ncbi:MAG: glycosyltransferase family 4 protein [Candidatus Korobacteraceae bacterium]
MSLPKTLPFRRPLNIAGPLPHPIKSVPVLDPTINLSLPSRIAIIGNYLPRQCGIATFTTDLCDAVSNEYGTERLFALPVNDPDSEYDYPERVRFELTEEKLSSYGDAAEFLNFTNVDLVCVQHEYGIFGGAAGSHILELLRNLRMPIVTTLHTVLRDPNPDQHRVMVELAELSDRLIVMSEHSSQFLREIFQVPASKIDVIPHGVPNLAFVDPNFYKDRFGVGGKSVLLTFGLLSPNKGVETVIQALPRILSHNSNVMYIVAGATHPHIRRREGDKYRESLQTLAKDLGVENNVIFHNRFVSPEEMMEFIGSADIYITPYRNEAQVVSGTLAYALGAGKAVISTPYWHALELLDQRRGVIVPFNDQDAIAEQTIQLLENEAERHAMRKRAYLYSRNMIWKSVAQDYMRTFQRARAERMWNPRLVSPNAVLASRVDSLPPVKLNHLSRMTDDTGMLQHAVFAVPNYHEGYATDDNARALIVSILAEPDAMNAEFPKTLASRYLAFLWLAFNPANGRFRNFLSYDREWQEPQGSEDSHGRALWSLGTAIHQTGNENLRGLAGRLFELAVPAVLSFTSPRAWAFSLFGIQEYLDRFSGDRSAQRHRDLLANKLLNIYQITRTQDWSWFEEGLAYSNARLSQALLLAGSRTSNDEWLTAGLESLEWLGKQQRCTMNGHFVPIGSQGFYSKKAGGKARFDQQPLEASATVSACLQAYRATGDEWWRAQAWTAFNWFLGDNDLKTALYDDSTGGCRDGLHPDRANENQGAESTLSFLMALLEMRQLQDVQIPGQHLN